MNHSGDTLGPAFRNTRVAHGVTLRAVASEAGISHSTVSRWERGQRDVSGPARLALVTALRTLRSAGT